MDTFCTTFCGYHSSYNLGPNYYKYAFVGDPTTQCLGTCSDLTSSTSPNGNVGADSMV